jgi:hypothetical protein
VSAALLALGLGLAAGAHTATWGMYKDAPHEGFTWRRYARSIVLSGVIAPVLHLAFGLDPTHAAGAVLLFGLTYACERGLVEFYKTFLREQDQSKYTIPMQFAVSGRVVESRRVRHTVGAAVAGAALALAAAVWVLPRPGSPAGQWLALAAAGSAGGWFSAFGGAWKDAPIEGFDWFKFFRSPAIALGWALLISRFADNYLLVALPALGYTIMTIETYKTFFFPDKPRGKFAGKPVLFPEMLEWRRRFVPLYAAVWVLVVGSLAVALASA